MGVRGGNIVVSTLLSHFPIGNVRYAELMERLIGRLNLRIWATTGSGYPEIEGVRRYARVLLPVRARLGRPYATKFLGPLAALLTRTDRADVYWLFDTAFPLLVYRLLGEKPFVLDADDPDFSQPPHPLLYDRRVVKVIVHTEMIKKKFIELYGLDARMLEVIPDGVDLRSFTPTPIPDSRTVVYVGTLAPHRSEFLSQVIREVNHRDKTVRFIIIGDPTPRFIKSIEACLDSVELAGYVSHDRVPVYIKKGAVGILPQSVSLGGRVSFKLLEYMACGRPIVATDVDESFLVKESGAGIITPVDPEAFAEAILKLLDDRKLSQELASRGVAFARNYSWDRIAERYIDIFQEVKLGR
ncbi:MAG: glycosyltransferase family 4 protein [Aigarchaeota archaeon]|nr:glycosyltransferase family 4 protein [Candidatus Calditenuis fumarioli]